MNERCSENFKTLLDALRQWLFGRPVPVKVAIPAAPERPMRRRH